MLVSLGWNQKLDAAQADTLRFSVEQVANNPLDLSEKFFVKAATILDKVLQQIDKDANNPANKDVHLSDKYPKDHQKVKPLKRKYDFEIHCQFLVQKMSLI